MGLRDRLARLEDKTGNRSSRPVSEETSRRLTLAREEECRSWLESMAHDLACGNEPLLTVEVDRSFYTPAGRLVLSPEFEDVPALYGKESVDYVENLPPERWSEFLDSEPRARELLSEIEDIAEDADVPDDYRTFLEDAESLVRDLSVREGLEDEIPTEPDTNERARRLAWVLLHEPESLRLLAELLALRDKFVA